MRFERGDLVACDWDTGARGMTTLYGIVEKAGPWTATFRWESGRRNRLPQGTHHVRPITDLEMADEAKRGLAK